MSPRKGDGGGPRWAGWDRLHRLVRRDGREDNEDEVGFHLEMRERDYRQAGMSGEEARAAARARLGDVDEIRRELDRLERAEIQREHRRRWLAEARQDLRYAARTLRRSPGFTAVAVLMLALGIGATTAIFSVVHAVLLAPLPYPEADRLVRIWETSPQGATRNPVSSGNVRKWQDRARSFSALGAHRTPYSVTLTGDGEARQVVIAAIEPSVSQTLDVAPALGRSFTPEDRVDGLGALLSHAFWTSRYGGDPDVIGRRVVLNDTPYTIVGVMPPRFDFPSDAVDIWLPLTEDELSPEEHTSHNFAVVARLAPGATLASAQTEMSHLAERIAEERPAEMTGWGVNVVSLHADITRDVEPLLWLLFAVVIVVLLITCGNLANLLLARAVARRREIAVRGALGAGRGRILRQLLSESTLLAVMGAVGALILAPLVLAGLAGTAPPEVPFVDRASVDLRMFAFAGALSLGSAALFGLAPALRLSRSDLDRALRGARGAGPRGHERLRATLLVAQVALSVLLLVGAGLFVRSFEALQDTELGFDPERLALMDVDLPSPRYPETSTQAAFYDRLRQGIEALPGVVSVTGTSQPPGEGSMMTFSFAIEGRTAANPSGREDDETLHVVWSGYFETLGLDMVAGRAFSRDDDAAPVVILNESLARKHFPEGDAVGQRLAFRPGETPWREIVGVVEDARLASPDVESEPALYVPFDQKSWAWLTWSTVVARTAPGVDPTTVLPALRTTLLELDPQLPPQSLETVTAAFRENTADRTFAMSLITGFGLLALLLSAFGLYGLISYSVARQRREIGVRIALGAASGAVAGGVVRRSLTLTLAGALVGVAAAAGLSRTIESLLYEVSPVDAPTYALTIGFVLVVAGITAAMPALRAARTDPVGALRAD